jgi:hypothetical protein
MFSIVAFIESIPRGKLTSNKSSWRKHEPWHPVACSSRKPKEHRGRFQDMFGVCRPYTVRSSPSPYTTIVPRTNHYPFILRFPVRTWYSVFLRVDHLLIFVCRQKFPRSQDLQPGSCLFSKDGGRLSCFSKDFILCCNFRVFPTVYWPTEHITLCPTTTCEVVVSLKPLMMPHAC